MNYKHLILVNGGNAYAISYTGSLINCPVMADGTINTKLSDVDWCEVDFDSIEKEQADVCRSIENDLRKADELVNKEYLQKNVNINETQERDY